jgi:hypothetical protein
MTNKYLIKIAGMWDTPGIASPPNPHVFNPDSPKYAPRVIKRQAAIRGGLKFGLGVGVGALALKALTSKPSQPDYSQYQQYGQ